MGRHDGYVLSDGEVGGLGIVLLTAFVGVSGLSWVAESTVGAVVALVLASVLVVGAFVHARRHTRRSAHLVLDEGGVRVTPRASGKHYVSFDEIESASVRKSPLGTVVELVTRSGRRRYSLAHEAPADLGQQLTQGAARARARAAPAGMLGALARGAQPLEAWLRRLRDMASADYRERPLDPDALVALVEDRSAHVELRAAAAHVLVWLRDHERASRVMAVLGPTTPPLVVVAATLATRQGTYVAEYDWAVEHLSPADRAAASKMLEERPRNLRVSTAGAAADLEPVDEASVEDARRAARR